MAVHQALLQLSPVETRLLILFWHLAERWGRVTPDGIVIGVQLSHEMLGHLVGCRRASVTTALARVVESGRLDRREDGSWVLHGSAPSELSTLHWQERHRAKRAKEPDDGHARAARHATDDSGLAGSGRTRGDRS